jgi:3-dehydro-L-gulonate 2-dehydrogenase
MIYLSVEEIEEKLKEKLVKHGCCEKNAGVISHIITENSLEGVYTHGVNRFLRLIRNMDQGLVHPDESPKLVSAFGGIERYDGNFGSGIINALFCTDRVIKLAKEHGIGCVGIRNTNHWFRGGTYGKMIAGAGLAGITFTNTTPNMPSWGAIEARIGNNPIVLSVPRKEGIIILDTSMSQFSYGKLEMSKLQNKQMPIDAGFDAEGNLTKDPAKVIESQRILPAGYWKGSSMSILLDALTTFVTAGNSTQKIGEYTVDETGISQTFLAINAKALGEEEETERTLNEMVEYITGAKAEKGTKLRYPGQFVNKIREENLEKGIPIDEEIWEKISLL